MTLLFIEDPTRWDQDKIDFLEDAGKCRQKDPGEHHGKERKLINLFLNYPEGSASLKALALCDPQKIIESIMKPTSSPLRPCRTWKTLLPGIWDFKSL